MRGVKIQPTPGTGLPPISRPLSNSQSCSPWNSWNESFDSTVAPVLSAMRSRKASPRPMAPAGGDTSSPAASASSNMLDLGGIDPVAERGVDDDGDHVVGILGHELAHGLVELGQARHGPAFGGDVGAVDDDVP